MKWSLALTLNLSSGHICFAPQFIQYGSGQSFSPPLCDIKLQWPLYFIWSLWSLCHRLRSWWLNRIHHNEQSYNTISCKLALMLTQITHSSVGTCRSEFAQTWSQPQVIVILYHNSYLAHHEIKYWQVGGKNPLNPDAADNVYAPISLKYIQSPTLHLGSCTFLRTQSIESQLGPQILDGNFSSLEWRSRRIWASTVAWSNKRQLNEL